MARLTAVLVMLAVFASACSSSNSESTTTEQEPVPRFLAATGSLAELVGSPFDASSVPVELGGGEPDALVGSVIINAESDPAGPDTTAMHWFVEEDSHANVVLSSLTTAADTTDPIWTPVSAWRLEMGADMILTVGTTVCAAPVHTYDWQNGEFVAVVNRDQNQAFGAWTVTKNGPSPYVDLVDLTCERFVP